MPVQSSTRGGGNASSAQHLPDARDVLLIPDGRRFGEEAFQVRARLLAIVRVQNGAEVEERVVQLWIEPHGRAPVIERFGPAPLSENNGRKRVVRAGETWIELERTREVV